MSVSKPSKDGVVKVTIPDAEILSVDLDEDSMGEPLTDTGFMTKSQKKKKPRHLQRRKITWKKLQRRMEIF